MGAPNHVDNAIYDLLSQLFPGGWLGFPVGAGHVFWVDGFNGLDTNPGTTPTLPFQTITYALTQCVNDRNDYIMVLDAWQEPAAVAINVTRVHIIGLGNYLRPNSNHPFVMLNAAADHAIFTVSALSNNCEIAGFSLGGGATHAGIENPGGTPMGLHIHDCVFGHQFAGNTPQDGIRVDLNTTNIRIERCTFLGADAGSKVDGLITRDGIRLQCAGDPRGGMIKDNRIMGIPGVGINLNAPFEDGAWIIEDNHFYMPIVDAAPAGWAITLQANVAGCMVNNNHAKQTGDGTGNNPYRDLSTGVLATCKNGWGMNYSGPAVISPVVV